MQPRVLMIGPAERLPGGMSAVVASYRQGGLFDAVRLSYLASYEGPGPLTQLRTFSRALVVVFMGLLRGRFDLLHVHSASRGSFWRKSLLCALARTFGCPYLFHVHSGEFSDFYHLECGRLGKWWIRLTLRRAAAVLVLTPGWQRAIADIEPRAVLRVAPNPVAVPSARPRRPETARRVLFLGRVRVKKGAFDLLHAFAAVLSQLPEARLVLAGDGDLAEARSLAAQLGVLDAIELPGWLAGAAKDRALDLADVFVLPSYFEGLPIGVLEAMAAGVPVLASRVGGIPDLVDDGVSGLLVKAGDRQALAASLLRLLRDRDTREALAEAAFARMAAHDERQVCADMAALYRGMMRGHEEVVR